MGEYFRKKYWMRYYSLVYLNDSYSLYIYCIRSLANSMRGQCRCIVEQLFFKCWAMCFYIIYSFRKADMTQTSRGCFMYDWTLNHKQEMQPFHCFLLSIIFITDTAAYDQNMQVHDTRRRRAAPQIAGSLVRPIVYVISFSTWITWCMIYYYLLNACGYTVQRTQYTANSIIEFIKCV